MIYVVETNSRGQWTEQCRKHTPMDAMGQAEALARNNNVCVRVREEHSEVRRMPPVRMLDM